MRSVEYEAYAKVNLTLDVVGKRPDGYHELITVMQSISLSDRIMVEVQDQPGIRLVCSAPAVPTDTRNTAWRAAERFLEKAGIKAGLQIVIDKHIPITAGLAGGSTDAAGVLTALDWLYPGKVDRRELFALAAGIGADVPFCLAGGTILCTGIGDILSPQPFVGTWPVLLVKAPFGLSTPDMFRRFDQEKTHARPDHDHFLKALSMTDWPGMAASAGNALEAAAFGLHPELAGIKDQMAKSGALLAQMSGSGPTMYGVFADKASLKFAKETLSVLVGLGFSLFEAETLSNGQAFLGSYEAFELPDFLNLPL